MSTTLQTNTGFDLDLTAFLPQLRAHALSLTRNRDRANDLVQQTALKALAGRESFRTGSNFAGWIFRIQRNEFISELRRTRPTVGLEAVAEHAVSQPPRQENAVRLREVLGALRQMSRNARESLLLSRLEGHSLRQIASRSGISIGTVKSRISRGSAALTKLLDAPSVPARRAHSHPD